MKIKIPSLQQVWHDSRRTFNRFSFVLINAAIGTIAALILIDYEGPPGPSVLFNILLAAIPGIPLLISLALTAEKMKLSRLKLIGGQLFGVLLLVAYALSVPSALVDAPAIHIIRMLVIAAALHLFTAVAPYIRGGDLNGFWQYNMTLFLRTLIAGLFSAILFGGLAIALAALDNLFGMNVPGKRYAELWVLIIGIFTTWFFLAGIPENLDELETLIAYPKGLKIFTQYILSPLVIIYLVILYAYMAKIITAWEWPNGWVSRLILGFSTAGLLSILLLHPIRDQLENAWMKTASRWFHVVMIPLIIMLFLALWRRIAEYGITEGRYAAVALGACLTVIEIYFIFSKTKNIKIVPGTFCVAALFVSFGPWGMFEVSEKSQTERLKELLVKNSILVDGTVRKAPKTISFEDTKQISSIIGYLHDIHGYDRIQPWFHESLRKDSLGTEMVCKEPALVAKMIGIEYVTVWLSPAENEFVLTTNHEGVLTVGGYDRMLRSQHIGGDWVNKYFQGEDITYKINAGLDTMTFIGIRDGKALDSLQIDLRQFLDKILKDYGNANAGNIPPEKMSVANENQSMKVKVYFRRLQVRKQGNELKPFTYEVDILYSTGREQ